MWDANVGIRRNAPVMLLSLITGLLDAHGEEPTRATELSYGMRGGAAFFTFRESLYSSVDPDSPGDLGERRYEIYLKPWLAFDRITASGRMFGRASWAYARTAEYVDENAVREDSADIDELYLGFTRDLSDSKLEVAAGRYPYQLAKGFLIGDGYADGGSRGGYWLNARKAWAPGVRIAYAFGQHSVEAFLLDRDERPESNGETRIAGFNYVWQAAADRVSIGASVLALKANAFRAELDGATISNLRAYAAPTRRLELDAEFVEESNGNTLAASAWYVRGRYRWTDKPWQPALEYRYASFEGDNPNTSVSEAYDPLFPSFEDWGTWWQGEIAGEYFLSNSNLKSQMLHLRLTPQSALSTGFLLFDHKLDQPATFGDGALSSEVGWELDWYLEWAVNRLVSVTFFLARAEPGAAVEQAFSRSQPFEYAMVYLSFSYD